jgi:hypothetical protein
VSDNQYDPQWTMDDDMERMPRVRSARFADRGTFGTGSGVGSFISLGWVQVNVATLWCGGVDSTAG